MRVHHEPFGQHKCSCALPDWIELPMQACKVRCSEVDREQSSELVTKQTQPDPLKQNVETMMPIDDEVHPPSLRMTSACATKRAFAHCRHAVAPCSADFRAGGKPSATFWLTV
jgi:hypothetical protein